MRKIKFTALLCLMLNLTNALFCLDFKHEESYGAQLKLDWLEFRYIRKSSDHADAKDYAGFKLDSSKLGTGFPLRFYAGNLGFSKAISRLKSPSYSSAINPLSANCIFYGDTAVSLPSKSGGSKTLSAALCYKDAVSAIEFIADENQTLCVTLSRSFENADYIRLKTAFTWMSFFLESKVQSSWKLSSPFFTGFKADAFYGEVLVKIPLVNVKIGAGAVENPFNVMRFYGTAETDFHYGPFTLSASAFASDNLFLEKKEAFFTPSLKSEKNILELNLNPRVHFSSRDFYLEAGLTGFYANSILKEGYDAQLKEKISGGAALKTGFGRNSIYLLYKIQDLTETGVKHTATVKYSHSFKKAGITISSSTTILDTPESAKQTVTQNTALYVYPRGFFLTYGSLNTSSEFKGQCIKTKANMSVSGEIPLKMVKILAKLTVSTVLEVE